MGRKTPQSFVELCLVLVDHQKVFSPGHQTLSKLYLIKSFANTKVVVVKKTSVNHQLKTAILPKKHVLQDGQSSHLLQDWNLLELYLLRLRIAVHHR